MSFLRREARDLRREADRLDDLGLATLAAERRREADVLARIADEADDT